MNVQYPTITNQKLALDKRALIFHSTLTLLQKNGFHGTPMSQIAKEAQVAIGSIYHYFTSKEELIIELFLYTKEQTLQAMFSEDDTQRNYQDRFFNIWKNLVLHYITYPEILSFFDQFYSSPFAKIVLTNDAFCLQDELSEFLETGIREKRIKDIDMNMISGSFMGTVIVAAKKHHNGTFLFDDRRMKDMAGIIWDGIKR